MRLTTRSEYGLLALIFLARQNREAYFSVDAIARAQRIPAKFLEQILLTLKRSGYVRSSRGPQGGYQLAKPAGVRSRSQRSFVSSMAPSPPPTR